MSKPSSLKANYFLIIKIHHNILDFKGCCECDRYQFLCKNKRCIPEQWKCNGIDNCGDSSDEFKSICHGNHHFIANQIMSQYL